MRTLLCLKGAAPTDDVMLTKDEQAQLNHIMFSRSELLSKWIAMTVLVLGPFLAYVALVVLYDKLVAPILPGNFFTNLLMPCGIYILGGTAVVMLGVYIAIRLIWEPHYRKALRSIGYDLCERCDYRLDGIDAAAPCPECGTARNTP